MRKNEPTFSEWLKFGFTKHIINIEKHDLLIILSGVILSIGIFISFFIGKVLNSDTAFILTSVVIFIISILILLYSLYIYDKSLKFRKLKNNENCDKYKPIFCPFKKEKEVFLG